MKLYFGKSMDIYAVHMRGCLYEKADLKIFKTIDDARRFVVRQWKRLYSNVEMEGSVMDRDELDTFVLIRVEQCLRKDNFLSTKNYLVREMIPNESRPNYDRGVFNLDCEWRIFKRTVKED